MPNSYKPRSYSMLRTSLIGIVMLLFFTTTSFAASEGVPIPPDQGKYSLGLEYNRIFVKDLKPKDFGSYRSMKINSSDQVYVVPSYGVYQGERFKVGVLGKVGIADLKIKGEDPVSNVEKIDYDMGFLWGLGSKASYNFENNLTLSLGVQYNAWYSDLDQANYRDQLSNNITKRANASVSEFQAAILLSAVFKQPGREDISYTPYIGPSFSEVKLDTGTISYTTASSGRTGIQTGASADQHVGVTVGVDVLTVSDTLRINAELRFITETAFSLSVHYKF